MLTSDQFDIEIENVPGTVPEILKKDPGEDVIKTLQAVVEPELTIITVSLNLCRFLEDTIRSVANQTFQNFEHIVIDGGSTDGTVEILKKYPHIKWISEKDSGYPDAFRKGLKMAKGKYIMQCCVSDGYANRNWFKYCVDLFNHDPDVSLIWGLPQYLSENGVAGKVSFPEYYKSSAPQKEKYFSDWLMKMSGCPEGNLCVRKNIAIKCYPKAECNAKELIDWNYFNYNFFVSGYLSYYLPVVANFGRTHDNQMGQRWKKRGIQRRMSNNYKKLVNNYRWRLIFGKENISFLDCNNQSVGAAFNRSVFLREYIMYKFSKDHFISKIKFYLYIFKKIPFKLKEFYRGINFKKLLINKCRR